MNERTERAIPIALEAQVNLTPEEIMSMTPDEIADQWAHEENARNLAVWGRKPRRDRKSEIATAKQRDAYGRFAGSEQSDEQQ